MTKAAVAIATAGLGLAGYGATTAAANPSPTAAASSFTFKMVPSLGAVAAHCIPNATATVKITPLGQVEQLDVTASGLPKSTDFDLFVLQLPNAPFGVSWYQGDLHTDSTGVGKGRYVGRFNEETFAVAPNVGPAPSVHQKPIADATSNPAFAPIHTYHLGLWFNSPADAAKAGCGSAVTPFNGEHNAGAQAMSTRQFRTLFGPLRHVLP
jgi:hypothetical protein